ncbi:MAG TPA: phage minor head protein [Gemmatimonadaceae bacterium]|nr:phage minor head protein [Gemmatimonadaceae bacterium]
MKASAVYAIADRLAPTLRRQWLTAVAAIQDQLSIAILAEAVLRGGNSAPLNKVINSFPVQLRGAAATVARIFEDSAQQAEVEIFKRLRMGGRFDIVNPKAVDVAARQGAQLVREVTESTRDAIRAVISRAITDGIPPREAAKFIRPLVGLTERQALAVVNYRTSLLGAGGSPTTVQAAAERYAAKLQRQRAVTIARTETVRASSAGQQAAWDSARADGLLPSNTLKEWQAAEDERLCPICSALDGQKVPLNDAFQSSNGALDGPPAHQQCRCRTSLVFPKRETA